LPAAFDFDFFLAFDPGSTRWTLMMTKPRTLRAFLLFFLTFTACHRASPPMSTEPVTISFIGTGPTAFSALVTVRQLLDEFTRETEIRVKFIPGPESATQRLDMYSKNLQEKSPNPEVYYVDMVWPAILSDYLLDLNPYLAEDAKQHLPSLVRNATVAGRLVAMPFNLEAGLLYYRTDLLQKYGYSHPPETWDELETWPPKFNPVSVLSDIATSGATSGRAQLTRD